MFAEQKITNFGKFLKSLFFRHKEHSEEKSFGTYFKIAVSLKNPIQYSNLRDPLDVQLLIPRISRVGVESHGVPNQ